MRNAVINAGSPPSDIWGALTGTWDESRGGFGWHYTKTPFFVALYGTFQAGSYTLPFCFGDNVVLSIAYADGTSENRVLRVVDKAVKVDQACVMQAVAFGAASDVKPIIQ